MAKDETTNKLKLVHLVWMLLVMAAGVTLTWGETINQQQTNTKAIEKKVEKEIFKMHTEQQKEQFETLGKWYEGMDKKLDELLAK